VRNWSAKQSFIIRLLKQYKMQPSAHTENKINAAKLNTAKFYDEHMPETITQCIVY